MKKIFYTKSRSLIKKRFIVFVLLALCIAVYSQSATPNPVAPNYVKGLQYSLYFYDANKCGPRVSETSKLEWRGDCHVEDATIPLSKTNLPADIYSQYESIFDPDGDGLMDLSGGYHDCGDHIRFGPPTAYSGSTLAWSLYEFKDAFIATGQYDHMVENIKWLADFYFRNIFVDSSGNIIAFCYMMGSGVDHNYWGAPELQQEKICPRDALFCFPGEGASDTCAGVSAFFSICYLIFEEDDPVFANKCLDLAVPLYDFAIAHRGMSECAGFYSPAYDEDELSWACVWLYAVTGDINYIRQIDSTEGGIYTGWMKKIIATTENSWQNIWVHCWDVAWAGVFTKLSTLFPENEQFDYFARWNLEYWAGGSVPHENPTDESFLNHSPGGYACRNTWGSARYNTAAQLCTYIYVKYHPDHMALADWGRGQMDYLLGDNPIDRCYLVGYSENSAKHPHHRAAHGGISNSMLDPPEHRHTLWGALVGGPGEGDEHKDDITEYAYNEVGIDYNAAVPGVFAGIISLYGFEEQEPVPDFPPLEPENVDYYAKARVNEENHERTQLTISINNESIHPPHFDDTLSVKYFFNIRELLDAGQTIDDIRFELNYDELFTQGLGSVATTGPFSCNGSEEIYYIQLSWEAAAIYGDYEYQFAVVAGMDSQYETHWDPTNDWSRQGLASEYIVTDYIPVYSSGTLVYGQEPDGTTPTPTPEDTPTPEVTPTPIDAPTPTPEVPYKLGDVNNDGSINIVDALLTAQYYVGLEPAVFYPDFADTDCNGSINIVDALLIAQYYVGLIEGFCL